MAVNSSSVVGMIICNGRLNFFATSWQKVKSVAIKSLVVTAIVSHPLSFRK